jgi:hypothetical protein
MYRVEKAAGLQACALAARLCSDPDLELGGESCEHSSERSDEDSCVLDVVCESPVDLGATADERAWLMRYGSSNCNRWQPGAAFACACKNGSLTTNHTLLADNGAAACGPLADFCMTGATPVFDGAEVCRSSYSSVDSEGCSRGDDCGPQMSLTADVSLVQLESRFATCAARSGGGSECSCANQDTGFLFQLSTPPNAASCEASIPNCNPRAVIKPTAPATCQEPPPDDTESDRCQVGLACVQAATVDDRSILARGSIAVICSRTAKGKPWVCAFASGPTTARLELGAASANAYQACKQATAAFLESPGVFLGPAGDLSPPPDPLP